MENHPHFSTYHLITLCFLALYGSSCTQTTPEGARVDWATYLGHPSGNQYSTLDQINKSNVAQLELAWTYKTGEAANYQTNNLIVDGWLYTATPNSRVVALDGATGKEQWTFDPSGVYESLADGDQRGLMYWHDGDVGRILTMKGNRLFALNAKTGEPIATFGENGSIHLGESMDVSGRPNVMLNTPGQIYKDLFIIGANVGEDVPGAVRAFDIRTGKRKWIFHSLPRPGEFGSDTWPANYLEKTGGASDWSGLAIDIPRGIVYVSTETAGPDFYGGDRYGENLFANSLIALDANTGKRLWHHQLVHHDLWDMDIPQPPTLLTVKHEGKEVDIVAVGTKMGLLFVYERVTGEPLWPIEERPQAATKIDEIQTWPTQPFPTAPPPLMRQKYTADDFSTISPRAQQMSKEVFRQSGNYGAYPPPGTEQTIMFPGYDGGMEWGGAAADPEGILYVNVNEIPWFYQLVPTKKADGSALPNGEKQYLIHCASCHGTDRKGNPAGSFPSLENVSSRLTKETVMQIINKGGGRMPAFDQVSQARREAIISFLFDEEPAVSSEIERDKQAPPYVFRGFQRWNDEEGYPAIKPPWGTLNAVDLNTGTIKWKVPLGEYEELTKRGVPITGTENYGGPVITAGGLLFIAATADAKIRAFDKDNGKVLWEYQLPAEGHATPSVYAVNGKQYLAISVGGSKLKPHPEGTVFVFSLPD
ncbi:PQQ-binding-like beta-propeller repeat protein [Cyclobacterium sp.]|uniref:outer membrane protein assembly factor BamB family protein n=1 Tax=Cyclobacterium sp. TaxID=1966343 RepID=UPI001996CE35|nr:PQQ-binding-like beta-propeller repeat protein [Cyclobacterium sp.]MBD3627534.1 PQQ-binding-like beta-propeller repeat protein [Cyclobacterium sp.]